MIAYKVLTRSRYNKLVSFIITGKGEHVYLENQINKPRSGYPGLLCFDSIDNAMRFTTTWASIKYEIWEVKIKKTELHRLIDVEDINRNEIDRLKVSIPDKKKAIIYGFVDRWGVYNDWPIGTIAASELKLIKKIYDTEDVHLENKKGE